MKLPVFLRYCSALFTAALLSSCAISQPTTYLPNDLKVTPVICEPNDMADILELKTWRFNITSVKVGQTLDCALELREKDKPTRRIGGITISPVGTNSQPEILVGLHPLSDSWSSSDQMKTFVRASGVSVNATSTAIQPNPFKNYNLTSGTPTPQDDDSFVLMTGNKTKSSPTLGAKKDDLTLVCTLTLKNNK